MDLSELDPADQADWLNSELAGVAQSLRDISAELDGIVDRDTLASLLMDLRDLKKQTDEVFKQTEARLLNEAGEKAFDIPMLGRFEVRKVNKRTGWAHDLLVPVLVQKANEERRFNGESGEVEPEGHAVARVLRECISFGAGKVTGLRARQIQADEFCTVEDGGYSVVLPPRHDFDSKESAA